MARRILVIAAVLIVAGFLYLGYTSYDAARTGASGEVFSMDSGASKAEPVKSHLTQVDPDPAPKPLGGQTSDSPAPSLSQGPVTSIAPDQGAQPGGVTPPTTDTISPEPPNGMVFSGTGHFQLYRQGNLTWRLNTDTGQSCILFATEEEWKKPKVLHAGCGKR